MENNNQPVVLSFTHSNEAEAAMEKTVIARLFLGNREVLGQPPSTSVFINSSSSGHPMRDPDAKVFVSFPPALGDFDFDRVLVQFPKTSELFIAGCKSKTVLSGDSVKVQFTNNKFEIARGHAHGY